MSKKWSHLIRFVHDGNEIYGDAIIPDGKSADDVVALASSDQLYARGIVSDDPFSDGRVSDTKLAVTELLSPIKREQTSVIRCIGLNYVKHVEEVGRKLPTYPPMFIKPASSLAAYNQDILVPKIAQNSTDYEGELTIVIGKAARNVSESDALRYVAGYVVSNDVSCRDWQADTALGPGGGQWCFSKGFDTWAPVGPVVVAPSIVGAADNLDLTTKVNGVVRQRSNSSDLLFGVRKLVAFCSQGTTLEPGSLIMTGTPSGVISGLKDMHYLRDGDIIEVSISKLGRVINKLRYE